MKRIVIILIALSTLTLQSCEGFLSERPSKSSSIVPSTVDDMESILAGMWRNDNITPYLIFGGGDIQLSVEMERRHPGSYPIFGVQAGTWEREHSGSNKDYMWMYRYQNIFRSNMVDHYLDEIEATEAQIQELRSKAAFRRALSYMELVNIYTLPYSAATLQEPGLVLTDEVGFDYSLERSTIEETYDFIERDIEEALKVKAKLKNSFGRESLYRVTDAVANALASRFYLMKHDYTKAKQYAQAALDLYGFDNVVNYNDIGYATRIDEGSIEIDGTTIDFQVRYPNTEIGYDYVSDWTEDYFVSTAMSGFTMFSISDHLPSQDLIDCFDQDGSADDDMRWNFFYLKNYAYLQGRAVDVPVYKKQRNYSITVPEMMLTVAECEAREGDYNVALNLVNQLRTKRIDPAGYTALTASNKDEAIAIVLRERRREVGPFYRLFDVRRYNSNDYPQDDVTLEFEFFDYSPLNVDHSSSMVTYTLKPGDRKIAAPIPDGDILAGAGVLKQNEY